MLRVSKWRSHHVRRAEDNAEEMVGSDSFLDVVTNIVGILILLVMVVGLRSSEAVGTLTQPQDESGLQLAENQLQEARHAAMHTEKEVHELVRRANATRSDTALREQERAWLTEAVANAEQEIAARRAHLTADEQRDFDIRRDLTAAQVKLEELTREQIALLSRDKAVEEIECEPTPLGKVVTGKEAHVLLSDDHVAIVPFEELLELMKEDVGANIWRLRTQDEMERSIGPVNGFRLRYWFIKTAVVARSEGGTVMAGSYPRFSRCYFLPVSNPVGEPAEEAMLPGSSFSQYLREMRPGTTITFWVYPENYERLRELKRAVRDAGFQTAVRPLPPGMPIGASRNGSESVSE
jgi:hypothetical protein